MTPDELEARAKAWELSKRLSSLLTTLHHEPIAISHPSWNMVWLVAEGDPERDALMGVLRQAQERLRQQAGVEEG